MEAFIKRQLLDKLLIVRACEHVARDAVDRTNMTTTNWKDLQNAAEVIADQCQQVAELLQN